MSIRVWCDECLKDTKHYRDGRCSSCVGRAARARQLASMTSEQRSEATRKAREAWMTQSTPEQRSEIARKGRASMTPEQRSEISRKGRASMTPEQRSEITRKAREAWMTQSTPEQRSEIARRANASRTPEQRSEVARKAQEAWMTQSTPEQRSEAARIAGTAAWSPERYTNMYLAIYRGKVGRSITRKRALIADLEAHLAALWCDRCRAKCVTCCEGAPQGVREGS